MTVEHAPQSCCAGVRFSPSTDGRVIVTEPPSFQAGLPTRDFLLTAEAPLLAVGGVRPVRRGWHLMPALAFVVALACTWVIVRDMPIRSRTT